MKQIQPACIKRKTELPHDRRPENLQLYLPVYSIFLLIYLITCFIEPVFFTWNNNVNLFTRVTPLIFAGMAQTFVLLTGGIDLSIGAIIG